MSSSKSGQEVQDPHLFELAHRAVTLWDLDVKTLEAIKIRENAVFRVISRDGTRAVLRIHRLGYHSSAALRSEFEWMEALGRSGVIVPRPILSAAGRVFEEVELPGAAGERQIDVLEWADGIQLGSVERGISAEVGSVETAYRAIGELAAQIHNQASDWRRPTTFVRHAWDLAGLCGESPFWGRFWELEALSTSQRILLEHVRARLRRVCLNFCV